MAYSKVSRSARALGVKPVPVRVDEVTGHRCANFTCHGRDRSRVPHAPRSVTVIVLGHGVPILRTASKTLISYLYGRERNEISLKLGVKAKRARAAHTVQSLDFFVARLLSF